MSFTRRTFLVGAGTGLSALVLTACAVDAQPEPTSSPTRTATGIVPAPVSFARSAWGKDSFARGAVSYMAVGSTLEHRKALSVPVLRRVFFAGEATSVDDAGTVSGARRSGGAAAAAVAEVGNANDRIAVIGAGAAGAEAARLLTESGFDVVVIEARKRTGGRIDTVSGEGWPFPAELGAWRISDADVIAELDRLEISTVELGAAADNAVFRSDTGESGSDAVGAAAVQSALAWAKQQARDDSVEASLDASGAAAVAATSDTGEIPGDDLLAQYLATVATVYGADSSELSSWFTDGGTEFARVVTGGFGAAIDDSLDGIETFLSTAVVGVAYSEERVSLRLGTGESLSVDRVVVTVPLGVLQDNSIDFDPLLPFEHRTAIAALGMGTIDTVWLRFDEPFWTTDAVVWNLVGTDDEITTWYNLEPLTGEPVLVGMVGGSAAKRTELLTDDELTTAVLQTLAPFAR
jgi:monoamine oxidase